MFLSSVCESAVSLGSSPFAVVPPFGRSLFTDPEDVVLSGFADVVLLGFVDVVLSGFAEVVAIVLGVWLLMVLLLPLKLFFLLAVRHLAVR